MGYQLYCFAKTIFKIPRSLSGDGNRQTLKEIDKILNHKLEIHEVASGTKAYDWTIPKEWNVKDAYILTPNGEKICDFKENNLHLVGYSTPQNLELDFNELKTHLYSLENQENAIPYITSYYKEYWGFCLQDSLKKELEHKYKNSKEKFEIVIDSTLENGFLSYGEILIKGKSEKEIILSTYICHPQMANNETSGICIATYLAKYLLEKTCYYTYRILFLPETIGAIYYLSTHLKQMQQNCIAGFVLTCLGDNNQYSFVTSQNGNNLADRCTRHILKNYYKDYKEYSYLERGSDERQYCAPGVDLPFCTLSRTKFGEYEEYHTSLDNLDFISKEGLEGGFNFVKKILETLEINKIYQNKILCEPQLGKYGLYPTLSTKESIKKIKDMRNLLMYCDGKRDLLEIAEICGFSLLEMKDSLKKFIELGLIEEVF
ncbi:aminopeptidase [Helicobacter valdiviensis]|uniref:Aminopeptidase n=1 Tax=Helicobacter valdiviensis TaxID=1458358 RepID=A0A2W6NM68_9HELI|nr:DUF4910 domain-containing protein [Helicobacter valdiviensis]PZT48516.1 aminopeptidase [Helicobacter valdiviensis]